MYVLSFCLFSSKTRPRILGPCPFWNRFSFGLILGSHGPPLKTLIFISGTQSDSVIPSLSNSYVGIYQEPLPGATEINPGATERGGGATERNQIPKPDNIIRKNQPQPQPTATTGHRRRPHWPYHHHRVGAAAPTAPPQGEVLGTFALCDIGACGVRTYGVSKARPKPTAICSAFRLARQST
jgi:hypothetical protein